MTNTKAYTMNKDTTGNIWFKDNNNNKCSVRYFGSEENAIKALQSSTGCADNVNCKNCRYSYNCKNCDNIVSRDNWKNNKCISRR